MAEPAQTNAGAAPGTLPAETYLIDDLAKLKVLADPLRVRILEALVEEARTTKQVAQVLGEKPTKLYHHVDALEKAGFVRLEKTRQNRGTLEKYFRAVARVFRADPGIFAGAGADDSWQGVAAQLFEQSAAELRKVPDTDIDADADAEPQAFIANMMVTASLREIEEIRERLQGLVDELAEPAEEPEQPSPSRRPYRLVIGLYPLED